MFVCTPWGRGWYLWIPEEGISAPETRVTDGRELPSECQDLNPSPLQEQEVVFTAESALQPFSVQEASAAHTQLTLSSQTQPLSLLCQHQCPQTVPVTISPSSRPRLQPCIAQAGLRCVENFLPLSGNYLGL